MRKNGSGSEKIQKAGFGSVFGSKKLEPPISIGKTIHILSFS
jgi:hypothetical protein